MGGCKCVYRNCPSSTNVTQGLHYFHFPVRDPERCEQWIVNSRKASYREMPKERLRNKVICSLHFEEHCFTNIKHERLIRNAVPTLGCEDAPEEEEQPPSYAKNDADNDDFIMLIPVNEDNTKFVLPDEMFTGMSYTIYDDAVIPSAAVPSVDPNIKTKVVKVQKSAYEQERTPKRPKYTVTSVNKISTPLNKSTPIKTKKELIISNENENNMTSYSLSTCGDDVKLELSTKKDDFDQLLEQGQSKTPLLDNDISLEPTGENEFSIAVVSDNMEAEEICEITKNDSNKTTENNSLPKNKEEFSLTPEKEYIKMIQSNSKQIIQLKKLINKQNRIHKYLLQKKQLCKFRRKFSDQHRLLDGLKKYLKPSLLAILKLEILPNDEIVLTDKEEKFITDLYTEDPDCYNLLRKKYQWNLPHAEEVTDEKN